MVWQPAPRPRVGDGPVKRVEHCRAVRALGGRPAKIVVGEHAPGGVFVRFAERGELAVDVHTGPFGVECSHQLVADAVGRASVEGDEFVDRAAGGQVREVGDPAEIQQHAAFVGIRKKQVIGERHQRRALPAGGAIGAAEVADDRAPAPGGDERRVEHLHRVRRFVVQRLPVARRRRHVLPGEIRCRHRGVDCRHVSQRYRPRHRGELRQSRLARVADGKDRRPQ